MLIVNGLVNFSGIELAWSLFGASFCEQTPRNTFKNCLIPAPKLVKHYRATSIVTGPTQSLVVLVGDGLLNFLGLNQHGSLPTLYSMGEPPQKALKIA